MADTDTNIKTYLKRNLTAVLKKQNTDVNERIASAIANAPHLTEVKVDSKDSIDLTAADADKKLYLVPNGKTTEDGDNLYDEYLVVDGKLEAVAENVTESGIGLNSLSAETTGTGNVVTAVSYDPETGKTTADKGITALTSDDLTDFTDDEIDEIIADAKKQAAE